MGQELTKLPAPIERVVTGGLPETVVRTALESVFKQAPPEVVGVALWICRDYGLDPLAKHVAVFQPKNASWTWMITVEGRIHIANRHPDFAGVKFSDPEETERGEIRIKCWVMRKSWPEALGPVVGRCNRIGAKSGGGTYDVAWAEEIARSRAIRNALRIAFGTSLPDIQDPAEAPIRADQRAQLFALSRELGWDDAERKKRAGQSFKELTEAQASTLIIEWNELLLEEEDAEEDRQDVVKTEELFDKLGSKSPTEADAGEDKKPDEPLSAPKSETASREDSSQGSGGGEAMRGSGAEPPTDPTQGDGPDAVPPQKSKTPTLDWLNDEALVMKLADHFGATDLAENFVRAWTKRKKINVEKSTVTPGLKHQVEELIKQSEVFKEEDDWAKAVDAAQQSLDAEVVE